MSRSVLLLGAAIWLAGCSADSYRQWADSQVRSLLQERNQATLGYDPQTEVAAPVVQRPGKTAYERLPFSPLPPPADWPIRPMVQEVPFGPLGPESWRLTGPAVQGTATELQQLQGSSIVAPLGPPAPGPEPVRLDLFGCIRYAVQHSRTYRERMEDLYLAALDVTLQRHLFSLRPFVQQTVAYSGDYDGLQYSAAVSAATSVGVRQKLPWGGEVVARTLVNFVDALSGNAQNGESAQAVLSASMPLLRGAGMVNLESLISSERTLVYEIRRFEDFRRSFAVDIASQFFRLLTRQQGLVNRQLNLISTRNLTARSQALFDAGKGSFLDVQRALQSQFSAESDVVTAYADYLAALDDLKLAIGMPIEQPMDVVGVALEVPEPSVGDKEAVETAFRYRLELQTAADRIEDARRAVDAARNGLMPDLNLTMQASTSSDPDSPSVSFGEDRASYSGTLTLDLPVDRLAERNAYRRALIGFERAQRNYSLLKDRIASNVRQALRSIRAASLNVEIQRRGIELAQRRLENTNELLKQGKIGNREIVDAQNDLLNAQDRYEQARGNLQIQILHYLQETGTLRVDPSAGAIGRAMTGQQVPLDDNARAAAQ